MKGSGQSECILMKSRPASEYPEMNLELQQQQHCPGHPVITRLTSGGKGLWGLWAKVMTINVSQSEHVKALISFSCCLAWEIFQSDEGHSKQRNCCDCQAFDPLVVLTQSVFCFPASVIARTYLPLRCVRGVHHDAEKRSRYQEECSSWGTSFARAEFLLYDAFPSLFRLRPERKTVNTLTKPLSFPVLERYWHCALVHTTETYHLNESKPLSGFKIHTSTACRLHPSEQTTPEEERN